jgi:hypothetical protein
LTNRTARPAREGLVRVSWPDPARLSPARVGERRRDHEEIERRMPRRIVRDQLRKLLTRGAQLVEVLPPEEYEE